jgi:transcriptional activator of cad operon
VVFDWLGNEKITVGEFVIDFKKTRLSNQNGIIKLEPLVMELLCYLIARKGEYVSQRDLLENVWSGRIVSDNAIRRVVKKLRDALGDDVKAARYIKTVPNKGYLLIANINIEQNPVVPTSNTYQNQAETQPAPKISTTIELNTYHDKGIPKYSLSKLIVFFFTILTLSILLFSAYFWSERSNRTMNIELLTSMPGEELGADYNEKNGAIIFSHRKSINGYYDIYLKMPNSQTIKKLTSGTANNNAAKWANSGKRLAYQRQKGEEVELMILDFDDNMKVTSSQSVYKYNTLQPTVFWSPDDLALYFVDKQSDKHPYSIFAIDISTKDIKQITFPDVESLGDYAAQFSPDGKYLAALRFRRYNRVHLMIFDMKSGKISSNNRINFAPINLTWGSKGKRIYYTSSEELQYFDVESEKFFNIDIENQKLRSISDACGVDCLIANTDYDNKSDIREIANPFNKVHKSDLEILEFPFDGDEGHPDYTNAANDIIFRATIDGLQQIVRYSMGEEIKLLTNFETDHRLIDISYHPNKSILLGLIDQQVFTLNLINNNINYITQQMENAQRPSWTADGKGIYYARRESGNSALIHYELASKKSTRIMSDILQAKEDKLGKFVYLLNSKGELHRKVNLLAQEQELIAIIPTDSNISWHVYENYLYYSSPKGKNFDLHRIHLSTGAKSVVAWQKNTYHAKFKVHPNGQKFLLMQNNLPNSDLVYIRDSRLSD